MRATECFSSMSSSSIAILNQAQLTFSELPFIIFSSLLRLSFPALIFKGNIGPVFAGTRSSSSAHSARFLWTSERNAPPQPLGIKRSFALYCHKSPRLWLKRWASDCISSRKAVLYKDYYGKQSTCSAIPCNCEKKMYTCISQAPINIIKDQIDDVPAHNLNLNHCTTQGVQNRPPRLF